MSFDLALYRIFNRGVPVTTPFGQREKGLRRADETPIPEEDVAEGPPVDSAPNHLGDLVTCHWFAEYV